MKIKAHVISFFVCLSFALGMLLGGFFAPPLGVIDNSVLTATGIVFAFAALGVAGNALDLNKTTKITKGDIEIEVGKNEG